MDRRRQHTFTAVCPDCRLMHRRSTRWLYGHEFVRCRCGSKIFVLDRIGLLSAPSLLTRLLNSLLWLLHR